jgi:hypothetical protein
MIAPPQSFVFAGDWGRVQTSRKWHPFRISGSGAFMFAGAGMYPSKSSGDRIKMVSILKERLTFSFL